MHFIKKCFASRFFNLYFLHLLNDGYMSSYLLLLPFLVVDFHINLFEAGLLGTLFNAVSIFVAFPAATIATKIGGLKTLSIAMLLYGLGFLATSFVPNHQWLYVLFIFTGIGFALFHPIGFAMVAKLADKEKRGKHMGDFTAIGDIGRIGLSAILTFLIVYLGWRYTSMIYASIAIGLALLFLLFWHKKEHFVTKQKKVQAVSFKTIISNKRFILATIAAFFDTLASNSLFIFLPFLLLKRGIDPILLGSFTAVFFFGTLFGKTVMGRLSDKFSAIKVFIISEILMAVFIVLLANATSIIVILTCSIILGIFTKGTLPVVISIITSTGDHHENYEKLFGINRTIVDIATAIAPVLLGFVSNQIGIVTAFLLMALFAILSALPIGLFPFVKPQAALAKVNRTVRNEDEEPTQTD